MNSTILQNKIESILENPQESQQFLDFVKYVALKKIPMEKNDDLKRVIENQDLYGFIGLLKSSVPNIDEYLLEYFSSS